MKYFELITFTVRVATHGKAVEKVKEALQSDGVGGQLFGCWYSELGTLNQVAVLRGFASLEDRQSERNRLLLDGNPLGVEEFMTGMEIEDYTLFPFLDGITPGDFGPFYELRVYNVRPSGLQATLDGWANAVPSRTTHDYSPLTAAFYATNGATPRIMHIWPYRTLEERLEVRTRTVKEGVWPPKGGPAQLLDMQSTIYLPADFSPLN